ncbi:fused MFS/spermidine synthase [Candidatus Palauibacter sp.]|uniref:fused MFS/spermidine synthase n=1 Tax=Candidatus Palauibacter sp. TaxID=3101350 RepID=UPI003B5C7A2E
MTAADLREADLHKVDLCGAALTAPGLRAADLRKADLRGAALTAPGPGWRPAAAPALILLAEGFASLGCELLALRKLIPVSGAGLQTNSVLIGCWLALLAWGYWRGGHALAAGRDERGRVLWCFTASAIVGFGALALDTFQMTTSWGLPIWASLAVCSLAASTIARFCGEIVARVPRCGWPGWTTSRVLFFSTLGSALAALALPLALMPFLGLSATVTLLVAVLAAGGFATGRRLEFGSGYRAASLAAALAAASYASASQSFFLSRTAYADYHVYEGPPAPEGSVGLAVNNSLASLHAPDGTGHAYVERLEAWLCEQGRDERILVIGAAGMTLGLGAPCELDITFSDIDPEQPRIAERWLGEPRGAPFLGLPAFRVLHEAAGVRWNTIVADAYTVGNMIPEHLLTLEFHQAVRRRLADGGMAVYNFIETGVKTVETRRMRTLHAVWADCWRLDGRRRGNSLVVCAKSELDGDRVVYSLGSGRAGLDLMQVGRGQTPMGN